MTQFNVETSECELHQKYTLLQAVLLHNQNRFTELAQEVKVMIYTAKQGDITRKK